MLRQMRTGILVLAVSASAHATPKDTVDALPEIATVTRGRTLVVIRGLAKRSTIQPLVEHIVADVQRRFTRARKDADPPITLAVLPDLAHYMAVARSFGDVPSTMGFYRPDHRIAIANLGDSIGNLRHELVHPLIGDDFPSIPTWLNEGTAALYGSARWTAHGFEFLINYRLRDLQKALKDGTLPTLAELAESTDADVHGERAMVMYAFARYVLLYADRRGDLSALYGELRDAAGDTAKQRDILLAHVDETEFRAWAKKLRY